MLTHFITLKQFITYKLTHLKTHFITQTLFFTHLIALTHYETNFITLTDFYNAFNNAIAFFYANLFLNDIF